MKPRACLRIGTVENFQGNEKLLSSISLFLLSSSHGLVTFIYLANFLYGAGDYSEIPIYFTQWSETRKFIKQ